MTGVEQNSTESKDNHRARVGYLVCAILILLINSATRFLQYKSISGDNGLYLQIGDLLLTGSIPYVDFFDTNPPLIMYMSTLPAALSRATGLNLTDSFQVAVLLLVAFSMTASYFVISKYARLNERWIADPVMLSYALLCVASMTDYGQREFIFMMFFLPYLFLRWTRWERSRIHPAIALFLGVLAGLGLSLKHYFMIPFLAVECYWLFLKRTPKTLVQPETIGVLSSVILYVLHFLLLPEASRNGFFNDLLPLLLKSYDAFNATGIVFVKNVWRIPTCLAILAIISGISFSKRSSIGGPLCVLTLFFMVLVVVQGKDWSYYGIPMLASSIMLVLLPLAQFKGLAGKSWSTGVIGGVATIIAVAQLVWMWKVVSYIPFEWERTVLAQSASGNRVLYLDLTSWPPWFAFSAHYNFQPATRYLWLYPITMLEFEKKRSAPQVRMKIDDELNALVQNIIEDVRKWQPELIVCRTTGCYRLPKDFNLFEYLESRGLNDSLQDYEQLARTDHYIYFKKIK